MYYPLVYLYLLIQQYNNLKLAHCINTSFVTVVLGRIVLTTSRKVRIGFKFKQGVSGPVSTPTTQVGWSGNWLLPIMLTNWPLLSAKVEEVWSDNETSAVISECPVFRFPAQRLLSLESIISLLMMRQNLHSLQHSLIHAHCSYDRNLCFTEQASSPWSGDHFFFAAFRVYLQEGSMHLEEQLWNSSGKSVIFFLKSCVVLNISFRKTNCWTSQYVPLQILVYVTIFISLTFVLEKPWRKFRI